MTLHLEILKKEVSEWEQEMTHVSNCGLKALSVPAGLKRAPRAHRWVLLLVPATSPDGPPSVGTQVLPFLWLLLC